MADRRQQTLCAKHPDRTGKGALTGFASLCGESAAEQIDKQGAVVWPGDVLLQDEAERAAESGIVLGMGENNGADDDLAAGITLAAAVLDARFVELTAR